MYPRIIEKKRKEKKKQNPQPTTTTNVISELLEAEELKL